MTTAVQAETDNAIRLVKITAENRGTPENQALIQQYTEVRAQAFIDHLGTDPYPPGLDDFDRDPNTLFLIAVNGGNRVVGGCRVMFSPPAPSETRKRLRIETGGDKLRMENIFPHLDVPNLICAELGGVAVDKACAGEALGLKLQQGIAQMVKNGEINADLIVGMVTSKNASIVLMAAKRMGLKLVLREDLPSHVYGTQHVAMTFTPRSDIELLSPEMKAAGIGMPSDTVTLADIMRLTGRDQQQGTA